MLIFKKIEQEFLKTKEEIINPMSADSQTESEQKLELLLKIISYTNSFEWLSHQVTQQKIKSFLKSKYDYAFVAQEYGVSIKSLHVTISYAGKKLESRIGKSLNMLVIGDLIGAEKELDVGMKNIKYSEVFLEGVLPLLPAPNNKTVVDLNDCEREFKILKLVSKQQMQNIIETFDEEKLGYILHLLKYSSTSFQQEREAILNFIEGEIDYSELIKLLNDSNIFT